MEIILPFGWKNPRRRCKKVTKQTKSSLVTYLNRRVTYFLVQSPNNLGTFPLFNFPPPLGQAGLRVANVMVPERATPGGWKDLQTGHVMNSSFPIQEVLNFSSDGWSSTFLCNAFNAYVCSVCKQNYCKPYLFHSCFSDLMWFVRVFLGHVHSNHQPFPEPDSWKPFRSNWVTPWPLERIQSKGPAASRRPNFWIIFATAPWCRDQYDIEWQTSTWMVHWSRKDGDSRNG